MWTSPSKNVGVTIENGDSSWGYNLVNSGYIMDDDWFNWDSTGH
jgi:uncharacterized membrane-anchored protein